MRWFLSILICLGVGCGCASTPSLQSDIHQLVLQNKYDRAIRLLENAKSSYGSNNELLFLMDKALVYHFAGDYRQSLEVFAAAKKKYDELYTKSLLRIAGSWAWNDYAAPYRGEDFERVLINIFQAVNYLALGDWSEALVEARDVDSVLNASNAQYPADQKNVYRDDAFARLLMGIAYDFSSRVSDQGDAYISYQKAFQTYENDYRPHYGLAAPRMLKERLLQASSRFDPAAFRKYREDFSAENISAAPQSADAANVLVVFYEGIIPPKVEDILVVPLDRGYVTKFAFPRYEKARAERTNPEFFLTGTGSGRQMFLAELGEDIAAIARKNLDDRKVRVMAKSVTRALGKGWLIREQEDLIEKEHDRETARWFRFFSEMLLFYSERADLRSWRMLPARIRLAYFQLKPGDYELEWGGQKIPLRVQAATPAVVVLRDF